MSSKIKIEELALSEISPLNAEEIKRVVGGAELLTNTRYYWEGDGIDKLEIYQIEGINR